MLTSLLDVNLYLIFYTQRLLPYSQIKISSKTTVNGDIREREFLVLIKYTAKVNLYVLKDTRSNKEPPTVQTVIRAIHMIAIQTPSIRFESVG